MKLPNSIQTDPDLKRGITLRRSAAALVVGVLLAMLLVVAATSDGREVADVAVDSAEPPIIFPEALPEPPVSDDSDAPPTCVPVPRVQGMFATRGRSATSAEGFLAPPRSSRTAGGIERSC